MASLHLFHIEANGRDRATRHWCQHLKPLRNEIFEILASISQKHKHEADGGKRLLKGEFAALQTQQVSHKRSSEEPDINTYGEDSQ
jgi:hypothetical protein